MMVILIHKIVACLCDIYTKCLCCSIEGQNLPIKKQVNFFVFSNINFKEHTLYFNNVF